MIVADPCAACLSVAFFARLMWERLTATAGIHGLTAANYIIISIACPFGTFAGTARGVWDSGEGLASAARIFLGVVAFDGIIGITNISSAFTAWVTGDVFERLATITGIFPRVVA